MNRLREAIAASAVGGVQIREGGSAAGTFRFADDFIGFQGHFPGTPILPAMVQVMAAMAVAENALGRRLRLKSVSRAKFHLRIGPRQEIRVECRAGTGEPRSRIQCRVLLAGETAASFQMVCGPPEEDP